MPLKTNEGSLLSGGRETQGRGEGGGGGRGETANDHTDHPDPLPPRAERGRHHKVDGISWVLKRKREQREGPRELGAMEKLWDQQVRTGGPGTLSRYGRNTRSERRKNLEKPQRVLKDFEKVKDETFTRFTKPFIKRGPRNNHSLLDSWLGVLQRGS